MGAADGELHDKTDEESAGDVDAEGAIGEGAAKAVVHPDGEEIAGKTAGSSENGYGYHGKHETTPTKSLFNEDTQDKQD